MTLRAGRFAPAFLCVAAVWLVAACTPPPEQVAHAECRRAWMRTFNVIFMGDISNADVRWVHACMEKRGFRRIYSVGRCSPIEASIREPGCYRQIDQEVPSRT